MSKQYGCKVIWATFIASYPQLPIYNIFSYESEWHIVLLVWPQLAEETHCDQPVQFILQPQHTDKPCEGMEVPYCNFELQL